jgi:outer membrane protein OmpA-like peptidoglycan-associated protein
MGTLVSALALVLAVLPARADDVADLLPSAIAGALSLTVGTDRSVAAGQGDGPSVDLLVGFEGDTHRLTIAGMKTLRTLAAALLDPSLDGVRFDIVGHAFLPNKPAAAQPLSARRAQAVAEHLTGFYDLDPSRFVTVTGAGASSTRSTNPADPMNQRIEIIRAGAN